MDETGFHLSVMEWLLKNKYKFFWECPLPNSRKRPDFLAVSNTGERCLFECKLKNRLPYSTTIAQIREYLELLNDKNVKPFLVYPEGTALRTKGRHDLEQADIEILFVPLVDFGKMSPHAWENSSTIADFFPTYPRKEPFAQNVWGRWILGDSK